MSDPERRVLTATWIPMYWSSLLPPTLTSDTSTDAGVRLPLTPLTAHAAWWAGSRDQIIRWRPATALDTDEASDLRSVDWPWSWLSTSRASASGF